MRPSALLAAALLLLLPGCDGKPAASARAFGGDPARGAAEIVAVGCGACHRIPGITGANALVGPPLDRMAQRVYVAGLLRNTPDNMITWLLDPQKIVPGNAMPNMHLKDQQARDIAAYLYTLE